MDHPAGPTALSVSSLAGLLFKGHSFATFRNIVARWTHEMSVYWFDWIVTAHLTEKLWSLFPHHYLIGVKIICHCSIVPWLAESPNMLRVIRLQKLYSRERSATQRHRHRIARRYKIGRQSAFHGRTGGRSHSSARVH